MLYMTSIIKIFGHFWYQSNSTNKTTLVMNMKSRWPKTEAKHVEMNLLWRFLNVDPPKYPSWGIAHPITWKYCFCGSTNHKLNNLVLWILWSKPMVTKYLRRIILLEFLYFALCHQPGLNPTSLRTKRSAHPPLFAGVACDGGADLSPVLTSDEPSRPNTTKSGLADNLGPYITHPRDKTHTHNTRS